MFLGGTNVAGAGKPKAERIKNGVPESADLPTGAHSWITAASAPSRDDIWAVTFLGGSVLNWNGSAWKTEPRGGWEAGTRFTGITAISATDVWVFGTAGRLHPGAGTWHFTGTAWKRVTGAAGGIFQASAAGRSDIWGIGNADIRSRLVPRRVCLAAERPRRSPFHRSHVLALSRSNVVGRRVAGVPKLGHFDGLAGKRLRMPERREPGCAATAVAASG